MLFHLTDDKVKIVPAWRSDFDALACSGQSRSALRYVKNYNQPGCMFQTGHAGFDLECFSNFHFHISPRANLFLPEARAARFTINFEQQRFFLI